MVRSDVPLTERKCTTMRNCTNPRGARFLVPGFLELLMYGRIFDPEMGPYPPRVRGTSIMDPSQPAISPWGWGFPRVW